MNIIWDMKVHRFPVLKKKYDRVARMLQDSENAPERTIRNIRDYESHTIGLDDRNRSVLRR